MTSDRARGANRRNAQSSTGPNTPEGKASSARNARKHGFSVKRLEAHDDVELANLTDQIAGKLNTNPEVFSVARSVAEAQSELERIRCFKLALMAEADMTHQVGSNQTATWNSQTEWRNFAAIEKLERYERRALSRRKFLIRRLSQITLSERNASTAI